MSSTIEVLIRELNNFVLTDINYEIIIYEDIKDYHLFYKYAILLLNRESIDYRHEIRDRHIKFNSQNNRVNYYFEKGYIGVSNKKFKYIPLIDNDVTLEIYRKKNIVVVYVIDLYSIVSYHYIYKEDLW